jgi:transposase
MSTQFDENPDTKTLLADGGPESAAVDFDLAPDMPGNEAEGVAVQRKETREATDEVDGLGDKDGVAPEATTLDDAVGAGTIDQPQDCGAVDNPGTSLVTLPPRGEGNGANKMRGTSLVTLPLCGETAVADDVISPVGSSARDDDDSDDESEPGDGIPGGNFGEGEAAADETARPQLSKEALESLLDESTGKLVALEAFECEVDDRARENEWLGKHTPISLAVFQEELDRTGKYTFNVDENGVLLDDPVKFRLAREAGAQITLRVHHGLNEAKKSNFILLTQGRERVRTWAEHQELQHRIIVAALLQGLTYEATAELAGVHPNTARNVEKRMANDPNSNLEITQPPDRRYAPETREKIAKAAELRKEGKSNAEIAETFGTDVETVGKWLKDRPSRDKAKRGKGKKKTPARRKEPTEDLAANEGIPDLHQRVLEHLGLSPKNYANIQKDARDGARETLEKIATDDAELLLHVIYGKYLTDFGEELLERRRRTDGEEDVVEEDVVEEEPVAAPDPSAGEYELGEILSGTVLAIEPDEVLVELPNGDRGVIGASDEGLTWHGQPDEGEEVRVEVNGFDSERDLVELGLVGRDPMSQDESVDVVEPDLDDLSPYERHFGRGEGSEE